MDIQYCWRPTTGELPSGARSVDPSPRRRPGGQAELLEVRAREKRRRIIEMIARAGLGHIGGDLSVTDILTTLYDGVLAIDPTEPDRDDRDRLVLSKGHCAAALYTSLATVATSPTDELDTFMQPLSALNGHPNRNKVPGVETNTGPLGHGLPFAVGTAMAAKLRGTLARVRDRSATANAGRQQLGGADGRRPRPSRQPVVVVDRNRLQQGDRTEETNALDPLADKLAAFGFEVREIDGHDYRALLDAFAPSTTGKPVAVIANTIKGKGVSFIEDRVEWHHKVPNAEQVAALASCDDELD